MNVRARCLLLCGLALCCAFDWPGQAERLTADLAQAGTRERREIVRLLSAMRAEEARDAILKACNDADPGVRREAMRGAALLRIDEAVPLLLKTLNDPDAGLRTAAADALGRLKATAAEQPLMRVLSDSEASVRRAAVRALTKVRTEASLGALISSLDDPDTDVRLEAILALADSASPRVRDALLGKTHDAVPAVRALALDAVTRVPDPRALAVLTQALDDSSDAVVLSAIRGLRKVAAEESQSTLAALENSPRVRVAKAASEALADRKPSPESPEAKSWLAWLELTAAATFDAEAVLDGLDLTLPAGEVLAFEPLALAYPKLPPELKVRALHLMGRTRAPKAAELFVALLRDPQPVVRATAAHELADVGNAKHAQDLVKSLNDGDPRVRHEVALALGKVSNPATQERLLAWLTGREQPEHPLTVLEALGYGLRRLRSHLSAENHERLLSYLDEALSRPSSEARAAIRALGELGDAAAVARLIKGADERPELTLARTHALIRADHASALKALRGLASHPGVPVRAAVVAALGVVGSEADVATIRAAQTGPWPLGPVASFALASLALRSLAPSTLLCPLLDSKEPVTRQNARVALTRTHSPDCRPPATAPEGAHAHTGAAPLAHTWRTLVFSDERRLIAYPDADNVIDLPDLTVTKQESPWKLPYGSDSSRL